MEGQKCLQEEVWKKSNCKCEQNIKKENRNKIKRKKGIRKIGKGEKRKKRG